MQLIVSQLLISPKFVRVSDEIVCSTCLQSRDKSLFRLRDNGNLESTCKLCTAIQQLKYRKERAEKLGLPYTIRTNNRKYLK